MTSSATKPKSAKLSAEKPLKLRGKKAAPLPHAKQRRCFEELSRAPGTDSGETLDRVFGEIVSAKSLKGRGD